MTDTKKAVTVAGKKSRASRSGKTLTSTEKAEAIALWRAGATTLDQLATQFGRSRETFLRLFNREGVTKGDLKEAHEKKVAAEAEAVLVNDATIRLKRIADVTDTNFRLITSLRNAVFNFAIRAKSENVPISKFAAEIRAYKEMIQSISMCREEHWVLLGLDKEDSNDGDDLPDLTIRELTVADIKAMHKQMEESSEVEGFTELAGDPEVLEGDSV